MKKRKAELKTFSIYLYLNNLQKLTQTCKYNMQDSTGLGFLRLLKISPPLTCPQAFPMRKWTFRRTQPRPENKSVTLV